METLPPFPCACATTRRLSRLLTQLYDSHLRASGIEAPQYNLLSIVQHKPGANQATLGAIMASDKTTISRNLRLLEQKGWIAATPSADRRERGFSLTAAGHQLLASAHPHWQAAQSAFQAALTPAEWKSMWAILGKITQVAHQLAADPSSAS